MYGTVCLMTPTTEPKQRPSQISETENIARKHLSAHNRLYFYVFTVLFYVTSSTAFFMVPRGAHFKPMFYRLSFVFATHGGFIVFRSNISGREINAPSAAAAAAAAAHCSALYIDVCLNATVA